MYWSQPLPRPADSTSWKQAAVPTTSVRLTIDAVVISRTRTRLLRTPPEKVDTSVVEIGGRKYVYSRSIPKGHPINVFFWLIASLTTRIGIKLRRKATHSVVHNILHRTGIVRWKADAIFSFLVFFEVAGLETKLLALLYGWVTVYKVVDEVERTNVLVYAESEFRPS